MALVDVDGILYPPCGVPMSANIYASNVLLDAQDEFMLCIFRAPRTGSIAKVGYYVGNISSPNMTLDYALEQVADSQAAPVATTVAGRTLWAANTYGQEVFSGSGSGGFRWGALTANASVTRGELVAFTLRCSSYTSGSLRAYHSFSSATHLNGNDTYVGYYLSSFLLSANLSLFGVQYTDGIYPISGQTIGCSYGNESWQQSTNPNRRGCKFKFPFACKLSAIHFGLDPDVDATFVLYDSDEYTALQTITIDKDKRRTAGQAPIFAHLSGHELAADTWYRWAVYPATAGTNIQMPYFQGVDDGSYKGLETIPMGVDCIKTTFNGTPTSGSHVWTDTDTVRYGCGFMLEQIHDGAGGGGLVQGFRTIPPRRHRRRVA